jgi:CBS domain-containing protein
MAVKEFMGSFLELDACATVKDAAEIMDKECNGSALVTKSGKPVGIITERDFLRKVVAQGKDPSKLKVEEIMSAPIITIDENEKVKAASQLMDEKNIRRLAVVNSEGKIVGKITAHGISRSFGFQKLKKSLTDNPRNYYAGNVR